MASEKDNVQVKIRSLRYQAIAKAFPATAGTMLIDTRLTDEPEASARVFRVYRPVPAHYHATCDEYLFVISGRARFFFADEPPFELGPGQLVFFKKGTVHGTSETPRGTIRRLFRRHAAPRPQRRHLRKSQRRNAGGVYPKSGFVLRD